MTPRDTPALPHLVAADWLRVGTIVYDQRLRLRGRVVDIGYPAGEKRQAERVWLRPMGGGREWNPLVEDLGPDTTGADHA